MRDPARIDRILNQFKVLWLSYPDLRFTQLIANMFELGDPDYDNIFFYVEDEKFEQMIQKKLKEGF